MKTEAPRIWPCRSRVRRAPAQASVRNPQGPKRPAAVRDREADRAANLVSRSAERWSKEARSALEVGLLAARTIRFAQSHFAPSGKSKQSQAGRRARRDERISDPSKNFDDHFLDWAFPFLPSHLTYRIPPRDGFSVAHCFTVPRVRPILRVVSCAVSDVPFPWVLDLPSICISFQRGTTRERPWTQVNPA